MQLGTESIATPDAGPLERLARFWPRRVGPAEPLAAALLDHYRTGRPRKVAATRADGVAFEIETEKADAGLGYRRLVADDWQCNGPTPITGVVWWGSYIGYGYQACDCQQMESPRQPDYFLLSIGSDSSLRHRKQLSPIDLALPRSQIHLLPR